MKPNSLQILCIDDEKEIRLALKTLFDYQGWESHLAHDVQEGIALFQKHRPDIILIDYHLPVINGVEGVRMLRYLSKTVPIIVFTIDESQDVANRFLEAGASDFALKPIKAPDLLSRIRLHIRLLQQNEKSADVPSAKGIGLSTLTLIRDYLLDQQHHLTADQIAEGTGLAYQTTYRYLQHMCAQNMLNVESTYGKVGRPKQGYKLL